MDDDRLFGYPNLRESDWAEKLYREAGMEPPWLRIYVDGEDVTDQPERWPKPIERRSRRSGRSRRW